LQTKALLDDNEEEDFIELELELIAELLLERGAILRQARPSHLKRESL
jgi:hypothetical protein